MEENALPASKLINSQDGSGQDSSKGGRKCASSIKTQQLHEKWDADPELLKKMQTRLASVSTDGLESDLMRLDKAKRLKIKELPYVKFKNGQTRIILPEAFTKEFKGCGTAVRWQIPLCMAWAITIHKSQGMTIDWLHVDLSNCFSQGQAYVACSRGTSLGSISVEKFSRQEIKTSDEVKKFYAALHNNNTSYSPPTWLDSLAHFRDSGEAEARLQNAMIRDYGDTKCASCDGPCLVWKVKSNGNGNGGKWCLKCKRVYKQGHTWKFVPVPKI
jgi:hypothetical protein